MGLWEAVMSPWEFPVRTRGAPPPLLMPTRTLRWWTSHCCSYLPWAPGSSSGWPSVSWGGGRWVLRTSSSCCVFLFPVKVSIISFFHFQILSFPPTSTELTEGGGGPVPQTQDHGEKKDHGFMVWSCFWPQYPLLVPSDPGTKSGVADYLWGRDWNKHYAVAWESIFCREAQRRRLHSRDPVCRAGGLRCVFLCQQLNHSLTETLLFCAQISWFSLFVACGSSRQAPLPPTYSSLCQGQTWVCR